MDFQHRAQSNKSCLLLLLTRLTLVALLESKSGFETLRQLADTRNDHLYSLWMNQTLLINRYTLVYTRITVGEEGEHSTFTFDPITFPYLLTRRNSHYSASTQYTKLSLHNINKTQILATQF
jgi:hypothetical protein